MLWNKCRIRRQRNLKMNDFASQNTLNISFCYHHWIWLAFHSYWFEKFFTLYFLFCTSIHYLIDPTGTPYGVTECDQLEAICGTYNGKYYSWGTGANTDCQCGSTDPISDCFEDNKLYVEDTLALPMTLEQCFKSCQSVTACQVNSHTIYIYIS